MGERTDEARQLEALRLELEATQQRILQDKLQLEQERLIFEEERHGAANDNQSAHDPPLRPNEAHGPTRSLREHSAPRVEDVDGPIVIRGIAANNMQINPAHVALVQQNPFYGLEQEDPHAHLQAFLDCTKLLKFNGVTQDSIRLLLFHFSLKDKAKKWYNTLKRGSIDDWGTMARIFLERYFPAKRAFEIRREITNFKQRGDESFREAWERFRDLENSCPNHGIQDWLTIHSFFNGLYDSIKVNVDALSGGSFTQLDAEQARAAIERCALQYNWPAPNPSRSNLARHEVKEIKDTRDRIAYLEAELAKMQSISGTHLLAKECGCCGQEGHKSPECPLQYGDGESEEVKSFEEVHNWYQNAMENEAGGSQGHQPRTFVPKKLYTNRTGNPPQGYQNRAVPFNNDRPQNFQRKPYVAPQVEQFMENKKQLNETILEGLARLEKESGAASRLEKMMEGFFASQNTRPQG